VLSARWIAQGRIMTAGVDGTARVWDGTTGMLLQTYQGWPGFLADAILTSEGLVIGGDADGSLRFWDAASGAKLWTLPAHKSAVIGVHLEGVDIVTRGLAGDISRWRLPQSEAVIEACAHHPPALTFDDEENNSQARIAQGDSPGALRTGTFARHRRTGNGYRRCRAVVEGQGVPGRCRAANEGQAVSDPRRSGLVVRDRG
jgi:WD40 repeat protein